MRLIMFVLRVGARLKERAPLCRRQLGGECLSPRPGTCRRVPLHSRSRPEAPTDRASLRLLQGARRSGLNEVQADSRTDACSSRCRRHVGPWRVRVTETEPFTVHRSPCIVSHRHCSIEPRSCPLHSTKHNGTAALSSHCQG